MTLRSAYSDLFSFIKVIVLIIKDQPPKLIEMIKEYQAKRLVPLILHEVDVRKLMGEYSEKSLFELDTLYVNLKATLRIQESSREVNVAIWKAFPYAVIPLVSASILAGLLNLQGDQLWILTIPIGVAVAITIISLYSIWKSKIVNNRMAETEIRLEQVNRIIQERYQLIKSSLQQLMAEVNKGAFSDLHEMSFNDKMDDGIDLVFKDSEDMFSSRRSLDLIHRHYLLMGSIKHLKSQKIDCIKEGAKLFRAVKREYLDIFPGDANIGPPPEVDFRVKAIIRVLVGELDSYERFDQKYRDYKVTKPEQEQIRYLLENNSDNNIFSKVVNDVQIKGLAVSFERSRKEIIENQREISTRIEYISYAPSSASILGSGIINV